MTITDEKLRASLEYLASENPYREGTQSHFNHEMCKPAHVERIEAALTELMELRAANTWQPIETAPRDGSLIVVYRPLAHLSQDPTLTLKRTTAEPSHCFEQTIPFGYNKNQHFNDGAAFATHWMPLPTPPKEGSHD